jgi:pyruvate,orthophosphate dikinase
MKRKKSYLYFFDDYKTFSSYTLQERKDLLGGKGAGLMGMTELGMPVPFGFIITTEASKLYSQQREAAFEQIWAEVLQGIKRIEEKTQTKFGDAENPLLLSVRSGCKYSMPGMLDTILNIGLSSVTVKALGNKSNNLHFALDLYRRFIAMFGSIVKGIERHRFNDVLDKIKAKQNVTTEIELSTDGLKEVIQEFLIIYQLETQTPFPENPFEQLELAIKAVFSSWYGKRAVKYREINNIPHDLSTACVIMTMVFGNLNDNSGTGVLFTRHSISGAKELFGEYLPRSQGEDIVAGLKTPLPLSFLQQEKPKIYQQLQKWCFKLERHCKDMLDIEFTIQNNILYLLQVRIGKRTAQAAVKIAIDLSQEKIITPEEAILRITPQDVNNFLHPRIKAGVCEKVLFQGLPASPGAGCGQVVFDSHEAEKRAKNNEKIILVRQETSPEDVGGISAVQGTITVKGGMTSHAAIVARALGKPCIVGCEQIIIDPIKEEIKINDLIIRKNDYVTIDGSSGQVFAGQMALQQPEMSLELIEIMKWADQYRELRIRVNADTPEEAKIAKEFGAEGVGLCRTEHMFFHQERLKLFQKMLLLDDLKDKQKALNELMTLHKSDFKGILKEMRGLPVTIRLLDPPLHEFLPSTLNERDIQILAENIGCSKNKVIELVLSLQENNPMLGFRGCRLGIVYPEIYEMQVRAMIEAVCELELEKIETKLEIMIPLITNYKEVIILKELILKRAEAVQEKYQTKIKYKIGIMIEVPRVALICKKIAPVVDFYSFGTNDLTQMIYGISRDDAGKFLPVYLHKEIFAVDPFISIDEEGVGKLMKDAVTAGRLGNKNLKIGICGEQGGDPASIEFCHKLGLNYVSCSVYRLLVARLVAAQIAIKSSYSHKT